MAGIWNSLGYDRVAFSVAKALRNSDDIAVIQGPPGIGKSWLAKGIGSLWDLGDGTTIVAEGDRLRSDVEFYALGFAVASLTSGWRAAAAPAVAAARLGEDLAGTGGVITATVQALAQLRPRERRARSMFLSDAEREVLFELERLAKDRPVLLVADNLHWWDRASLEFLGRLRTPPMRNAFLFLNNLHVLAVRTPAPFQSQSHPAAVESLLAPATTRYFTLDRISRQDLGRVLLDLGARETPPPDVVDAVFTLTGGHLALARKCAARLNDGDTDAFIGQVDTSEFLARILTERIRSLGPLGAEAVELLQIAALLGLRFRRDEVACAWGNSAAQTSQVLRYLRDQDMVDLAEETATFVHELYREHFLGAEGLDRVAVHERLADCLRLLDPADYESRCQNALRAERPTEAATLAAQAALAHMRDGRSPSALSGEAARALSDGGFTETVATFVSAIRHMDRDRYAECLTELNRLPRALPEPLLAESDLLRANCLMQTRSDADRQSARSILDAWSGYEETEPELGVRLMMQHLFGLAMMADHAQGRTLENRIRTVLRPRTMFDKAAEDAMYLLDRCAPSLHEPDIALLRVRDAVDYHRPAAGRDVVRRPVEFFKALVNLAAEQTLNARYDDALATSAELEELIGRFDAGTFPRLDFPRGTALLAEVRLGTATPRQAVSRQRKIVADHDVEGDPFYPQNALAVYLALDGRFEESLTILDGLLSLLESRHDPEPSMVYLLRANRCSVRFVAGERHRLLDEWMGLRPTAERIPYPIRRFLIRRHELLEEVIHGGGDYDPEQFDLCVIRDRRPELGPMWDQLGRGFRLPEVEWWH